MALDPGLLFAPSRPLSSDDFRLFTGRENELRMIVEWATFGGSTLVVYGDRGVGKTSLAYAAASLLNRDERVSKYFGPAFRYLDKSRVRTFWVVCDRQCRTFYDVLRKFLVISKAQGNVETLGLDVVSTPQEGEDARTIPERDWAIESTFIAWGRSIRERGEVDEAVIFIDEFDVVADKQAFAQFAKNMSGSGIKFVVVGIAGTVEDLLAEHRSIARTLSVVHVPPFSSMEIEGIFRNAEAIARENNMPPVKFAEEFVLQVIDASGGFPYVAQSIGYNAVRELLVANAGREKAAFIVTGEDFRRAIDPILTGQWIEVAGNAIDPLREAIYESKRSRTILAAIVSRTTNWVNSRELLRSLGQSERQGFFDQVDRLVRGAVLERSPLERDNIRFSSPIVRIFAKAMLKAAEEQEEPKRG